MELLVLFTELGPHYDLYDIAYRVRPSGPTQPWTASHTGLAFDPPLVLGSTGLWLCATAIYSLARHIKRRSDWTGGEYTNTVHQLDYSTAAQRFLPRL